MAGGAAAGHQDPAITNTAATHNTVSTRRPVRRPAVGSPAANTTFRPAEISHAIEFRRGLPGTRYEFWLYYSNSSLTDWLTWTASITTAPDPPSDLQVSVEAGQRAEVAWQPPATGQHSGFKLKVKQNH